MDTDEIIQALLSKWWGRALVCLFFVGLTWLFYHVLSDVEEGTGNARVPWYIALTYYIGGKWALVGPLAVVSGLFGLMSIHQLITGRE
jgi:hypothetical protein